MIHVGDCLAVLRTMASESVDAIVTDPPYGLSFMGKRWDYDVPSVEVWAECLRVLKPGGHLLAFAGTRTQHRMAVRIEDAGFEIRDMIAWVYGSGFPKNLDVSKAIDKAAGMTRTEVIGRYQPPGMDGPWNLTQATDERTVEVFASSRNNLDILAPATEEARQWSGWGTALKPSLEPITVARKPLAGTVAENVLTYGTGALNIDGCRIPSEARDPITGRGGIPARNEESTSRGPGVVTQPHELGRWPANLVHDGSGEVLVAFPDAPGQQGDLTGDEPSRPFKNAYGVMEGRRVAQARIDTVSAARFFYCAKASREDRDAGLEGFEKSLPASALARVSQLRGEEATRISSTKNPRSNTHPTVKPTDLMRWLCRLVTPPGGVVLDPFMGSGSTGKAAVMEGFQFIGIELEEDYARIADARIRAVQPGLAL